MRVDRTIAALRADRTALQRAQATAGAAAQSWRETARIAPILAELAEYGGGAPLSTCPELAGLFEAGPEAGEFVASFCRSQAGAMAQERFLQVAFRHSFDGHTSTLLLARAGAAQLTLMAVEPGHYEVTSAALSDAVRHEAVLAGQAVARRFGRQENGQFSHEALDLRPGARVTLDLSRHALCIEGVDRRLVSLRLHRIHAEPRPTREYDLTSGNLLNQASSDVRASRQETMLALLGRMRRTEAAREIAAIAHEAGPDGLRWQALREALALHTAEGFRALCDVATAPGDPLAMPAGTLRAQLVEAHPELLALEAAKCRA